MPLKRILIALVFVSLLASCSSSDNSSDDGMPMVDHGDNLLNLGASANDLLSDANFSSMTIEIAYTEGFRPQSGTIQNIRNFLEDRLNKPGGIALVFNEIAPPGDGEPYNSSEIREIEDDVRTIYNEGDDIAVWIFFADNNSESDQGNSVVLGTAYRNTSIVIYAKTMQDLQDQSVTAVNRTTIESVTLMHEFGHIFGLVDLGSLPQSDHEDPNSEHHCDVEECLMYFQTVTNIFSQSDINQLPMLDAQCVADLQANGGK